jgi:hypothetical protein
MRNTPRYMTGHGRTRLQQQGQLSLLLKICILLDLSVFVYVLLLFFRVQCKLYMPALLGTEGMFSRVPLLWYIQNTLNTCLVQAQQI